MTIISKERIIQEYECIYNEFKNDAIRFAQVALRLGIEVKTVVEVLYEDQRRLENV